MATNTTSVKNNVVGPRITEKAALASDKGCYVFNVSVDSTKSEIKKEIETMYKVTPVKVNIAKAAKKQVLNKNGRGTKGGVKKAYVYLKEGDKINLI